MQLKLMHILIEQALTDQVIDYQVHGGKLDGTTGKGTFKGVLNFFKIHGIKLYDLIKMEHLRKLAQGLPVQFEYLKSIITLKKEPYNARIV